MKIKPIGDRVLVKMEDVEEKTKGGIFIPQTAQEKTQTGVVEAIGDDNSPGTERSTRFSRMFHERMQPEIVRQSTVVLKGSGRGEIRMTLRPENLGNLRMRLALDQNRVTGRIIVESSAVKMLLDQNLESLSRSFRESGFDAANFEVTVSGGDQNHHSKNQQREVAYDGTASRNATQKMDETASLVEATADTTINLVV